MELIRRFKGSKIVVMILLAFLSISSFQLNNAQAEVSRVSVKEAATLVKNKKAVLVDVREENEAADGMAEPAQLVPLSDMNSNAPRWQDFIKKLDKNKEVVVYCRSGHRAGIVGEKLDGLGYKVRNMGGFSAWQSENLPTKKYHK